MRKAEAAERNARAKAQREREKAVADAEAKMQELENKQIELAKALEDPACYADASLALRLNRELKTVRQEIERTTTLWEAAEAELSAAAQS